MTNIDNSSWARVPGFIFYFCSWTLKPNRTPVILVFWLLCVFRGCCCVSTGRCAFGEFIGTLHQTPLQGLLAVVILLYLHPKGVLIAPLCRCHGAGLHRRGQHRAKRTACFPFQPGAERRRCGETAAFCRRVVCFAVLFFSKHAEGFFSAVTCTFEWFCAIVGNRKNILQEAVKTGFQHGSEECCNGGIAARVKAASADVSYFATMFCLSTCKLGWYYCLFLFPMSFPVAAIPNEWINALD